MFHETRETQSCEGRDSGQIRLRSLDHKVETFSTLGPIQLLSHLDLGYSSNQGSQMRSNKYPSSFNGHFLDCCNMHKLKTYLQTETLFKYNPSLSNHRHKCRQRKTSEPLWAQTPRVAKNWYRVWNYQPWTANKMCKKNRFRKGFWQSLVVSCWAPNRSFGPQNSWHDV